MGRVEEANADHDAVLLTRLTRKSLWEIVVRLSFFCLFIVLYKVVSCVWFVSERVELPFVWCVVLFQTSKTSSIIVAKIKWLLLV